MLAIYLIILELSLTCAFTRAVNIPDWVLEPLLVMSRLPAKSPFPVEGQEPSTEQRLGRSACNLK
jgi:hypothetical protein